jgi:hypothetical protein
MNRLRESRRAVWFACALASAPFLLPGCAAPDAGPRLPQYRCEKSFDFTVRFVDNSAMLDSGPRGRDVVYLDAGGQGPAQSVYSNPRMRAEFGLGAGGREAVLHYFQIPLVVRCVRD